MTHDPWQLALDCLPEIQRVTRAAPQRGAIDREDLAQEAILRVRISADRYKPSRARFKTFANRRAKGAIRDLVRNESRHTHAELKENTSVPVRANHLREAIAKLRPRERQIIELVLEGLTAAEIGARLKMSAGYACRLKLYAIERLRSILLNLGIPPHTP